MKKYKYFTIMQLPDERFNAKPVYRIFNNKSEDEIGALSWYKPWKQYVFSTDKDSVFNASCLKDVIDFMENHAEK